MGGGGKKGGAKIRIAEYFMSLHYGVCVGPVEYVREIFIKEKSVWVGRARGAQSFSINKPDLFGGAKKEGGVEGTVHLMPGDSDQLMPAPLAQRVGLTPATAPGYRGLMTLAFLGGRRRGFMWSANSPFIPGPWVTVSRPSLYEMNPNTARIYTSGQSLDRQSIFFALDRSGSLTEAAVNTIKTGMNSVLDLIEDAVNDGAMLDVAICLWDATAETVARRNVDGADIAALRAIINGLVPGTTTNYNAPMQVASTWFSASLDDPNLTRRTLIFLTDGEPNPLYTIDEAEITAADMLDQNSGQFNRADGTEVNMHGMNLILEDTQYTRRLDNTANDDIPIISETDSDALIQAVQEAILGGGDKWESRYDSNPAHMIYECMRDPVWGMGEVASAFDLNSFNAAAQTLYLERFGLSMSWVNQMTIEAFVGEIIDHIQGNLYVDPETGLWTLTLIRDDYDPDNLPTLDPDNCEVTNFQRKLWGETINELVVTWTNPENEQEETVSLQDLGNIAVQGSVVSDSANYYGVRTRELAMTVCARDLRVGASPLAVAEIETFRTQYKFRPGTVFKLDYPDHNVSDMVCRVINADYGKPGDPMIKINVAEDVFSQTPASFEVPPGTAWETTDEDPRPVDHSMVLTAPFYMVAQLLSVSDLDTSEYPDTFAIILASQSGADTSQFEVYAEVPQPTGTPIVDSIGTFDILSRATINDVLEFEVESTIAFSGMTQGFGPETSGFVAIGEGTDEEVEIGLITGVTEQGEVVVRRGALDTIPREWPVGTPIWFISQGDRILDGTVLVGGQSVEYQLAPWTSNGVLPVAEAPVLEGEVSDRPWLPSRPANVRVSGEMVGLVNAIGLTDIPVTWANRNRVEEDSVVLPWDEASVDPEDGQTTTITVMDTARNVLATHDGLTGTNFDIPIASFGGNSIGIVRVSSERDGLESLQAHEIAVMVQQVGYGTGYGYRYGGVV